MRDTERRVRDRLERLADGVGQALVLEVARRGDHEVRRLVGVAEVLDQHREVHARHRATGSLDRPAEGVVPPERLAEDVVHQLVGRVVDHLDLFVDDLALLLDFLRDELGMPHDVRQQVHGDVQVLVEDLEVEAGVLLRGEGVHLAAHGIDDERDVLGAAGLRALEQEVLDEVGDAVLLRRLVARAAFHPYPQGDRAQVAHRLGDQDQTVREDLLADLVHGAHGNTGKASIRSPSARPDRFISGWSRRTFRFRSGRSWSRRQGAPRAPHHTCGW